MSISKHAASSIALNLAFVYHAQHGLSCDLAEKILTITDKTSNKQSALSFQRQCK
jgi:hypothetical protein